MRNPFREWAGRVQHGRRQAEIDQLNAEKGRANQPKPQAQPAMPIERRYHVYWAQNGGLVLTPRQRRRIVKKANRSSRGSL